jgi:hypothetical protein
MSTHQGSRPGDPTTTATTTTRTSTPTISTELYEAGFSTLGDRPLGGVAMARTIDEARQRLADMLLFADPTAPTTADIVAFHRADTADHYHGTTADDIYRKVNNGEPGRTVIARPLTTSSCAAADAATDGRR